MTTPHPSYGFLTKEEFQKFDAMPLGEQREHEKKRLSRVAAGRKAAHTRKNRAWERSQRQPLSAATA
jgi:hypothetical protein